MGHAVPLVIEESKLEGLALYDLLPTEDDLVQHQKCGSVVLFGAQVKEY